MRDHHRNRLTNRLRPGDPLRADELNQIVDSLVGRIEGGLGIDVRSFNDQVFIESDPDVVVRRATGELFAIVRDDATLNSTKIRVDLYGSTPDSFGLDGEGAQKDPTQEDVLAWRDVDWNPGEYIRYYQYGELVTVAWVKATEEDVAHYAIDKVHESDLRTQLVAGQVAVTRGLDGLALDAAVVMETYLRREDQTEENGGYIIVVDPGRTIYAFNFYRSFGPMAFWPILTTAEAAAISVVYDTVANWAALKTWLNYREDVVSVFTIPGDATTVGAFTFIRDDLVDVYPVVGFCSVDDATHTLDWEAAGFGTFAGRITVGADVAPNIYIPQVPEYRAYDWDDIEGLEEFDQNIDKSHYLETDIYWSYAVGAVAAKFWAGRQMYGLVADVRELTATYSIRGYDLNTTAECPIGTVKTGKYEQAASGISESVEAKWRFNGKDLVTTPYENFDGVEWTFG